MREDVRLTNHLFFMSEIEEAELEKERGSRCVSKDSEEGVEGGVGVTQGRGRDNRGCRRSIRV